MCLEGVKKKPLKINDSHIAYFAVESFLKENPSEICSKMTIALDDIQAEVDQNYDAFVKILPDLLENHRGKYVLMRHKKPVEFFDTTRDAIVHATKTYNDGLFSVQEITKRPIDLGWFSDAAIHE